MRNRSIAERLVHLVLFVAFLAATGVEAAGLQRCRLHDALPAGQHPEAPPVSTGGATDASAHGGGPHCSGPDLTTPAPDHSHDGDTCTCVGDCDVQTPTAAGEFDADLLDDIPPTLSVPTLLAGGDDLRGPRHGLFELHLPNAPPRSD